jgi:hypothetical protein
MDRHALLTVLGELRLVTRLLLPRLSARHQILDLVLDLATIDWSGSPRRLDSQEERLGEMRSPCTARCLGRIKAGGPDCRIRQTVHMIHRASQAELSTVIGATSLAQA